MLAIVGALMLSYSRARAEASLETEFGGLASALGARDVRLLVVMVGGVIGQGLATLAFLALLSNSVVVWRFAQVRDR